MANRRFHTKDRRGFIYVVQCGPNYKIGLTRSPQSRLAILKSGMPHFSLFGIWEVRHPVAATPERIESDLHRNYADCRVGGEWFLIPDDELVELGEMLDSILVRVFEEHGYYANEEEWFAEARKATDLIHWIPGRGTQRSAEEPTA